MTADGKARSTADRQNKAARWRTHLLFLLGVMLVWELTARLSAVTPLLLPPVSEVIASLGTDLASGVLAGRIGFSLLIIFEGVALGALGALLLSAAVWSGGRSVARIVDSAVAFLHPLPGIALLPLVILWAGTGRTAVLLIITHSVLWPLTTNLTGGIRAVPEHLYDVSRNYRLGHLQTMRHLILPSTLPYLIAGLRIGWARAWRALIAAEMVFGAAGGGGGLGWYLFQQRVFMDTRGMFAGILVIMVIGVLFEELLFESLERGTVRKWGMSR
ncbi:MAG: ABC transporter permease [Spirochaetota bacterium]